MKPGVWYNVEKNSVDEMKKRYDDLLDKGIELTFNSDYTKVKKTLWNKNRPVL